MVVKKQSMVSTGVAKASIFFDFGCKCTQSRFDALATQYSDC
jgi:hypothetical protein